jgi:hypothetical protein
MKLFISEFCNAVIAIIAALAFLFACAVVINPRAAFGLVDGVNHTTDKATVTVHAEEM